VDPTPPKLFVVGLRRLQVVEDWVFRRVVVLFPRNYSGAQREYWKSSDQSVDASCTPAMAIKVSLTEI
jgi:hypothetical protein